MTVSDFTPEALTKLEACLLEDLQVVRRMRALMEEYRGRLGPAAPAQTAGLHATTTPPVPAPPRKSLNEVMLESLPAMPAAGFRMKDLRLQLRKAGCHPTDAALKGFINRMIRLGKATVQEKKTGRGGSIYRCTLPLPARDETAPSPAENAPVPPESASPPSESAPPPPVSASAQAVS